MSSLRLFVALPVPDDVKALIGALSRKGVEGRWIAPDDFHLTIRFLGDIEQERVPDIIKALSRVRRAPFYVEGQGLSAFYNKSQTVLYAAMTSTRKLTALCTEVTDVLTPLGFDFGMRPYVPHLTVARLKSPPKKVEHYIKSQSSRLHYNWQVTSFSLMQSAPPDEKERRYHTIHSFPLSS